MESQPIKPIKVKRTRVTRHKNFHFKVVVNIKGMPPLIKYYFTKKDIKDEHGISAMSIHRILTIPGHKLRKKYQHLTISKVCEPARIVEQLIQPITTPEACSASVSQSEPSSLE